MPRCLFPKAEYFKVYIIHVFNETFLLTITTLRANSADDKLIIFSQKTGIDILCKFSPNKNISECVL